MSGVVRSARRPRGWVAPGPTPPGALGRADLEPADDEDLCFLCGDFRVFQKLRGNRWSLDELVTAQVACEAGDVRRALDLGCGVGAVMLMVAWRFPTARVAGVEAQDVSAALARRSLAYDGVDDRCEVRVGDMRDHGAIEPQAYDLITGTPPYFPRGTGRESNKVQCAPARFEHRGGVEVYVSAAAHALAEDGRFVVCTAPAEAARVQLATQETSLAIVDELDVIPREGKPARVSVFTLRRGACAHPQRRTLTVRDARGAWTADFLSVRDAMGMPPRSDH